MAISSLSTSSMVSGVKRRKIWDQLATTDGFFQIATTTLNVAAGSVEFTNIPATYTHLQIRGIVRTVRATQGDNLYLRFNGDTGSNYTVHQLQGNGSSASSYNSINQSYAEGVFECSTDFNSASIYGCAVIDILDYANTNKFKTIRALNGYDANGSGTLNLRSNLWRSTNAVTTIRLDAVSGSQIKQYSSFALYGIKG